MCLSTSNVLITFYLYIKFAIVYGISLTGPSDVVVQIDSSTHLSCTVTSFQGSTAIWTKQVQTGYEELFSITPVGVFLLSGDKYPQLSLSQSGNNYRLQVSPVSLDDDGIYECRPRDIVAGSDPNYQARLVVLDEDPKCSFLPLSYVGPNKEVIAGSTVTLKCTINNGTPPGSLQWKKNGSVSAASGSSSLSWNQEITKLNMNDEYNCEYNHESLSQQPNCGDNVKFIVQYPPVVSVSLSGDISNGKITEGDGFTAVCSVTEANPSTSPTWTKDSSTVGSGGTLSISNIIKDESGDYKCSATNTYHNGQHGSDEYILSVDVQYTANSASISNPSGGKMVQGSTFIATCSADSNPSSTYSWTDPNTQPIQATGGTLSVHNIQKVQSGGYICTATNRLEDTTVGSVSAAITVVVQYPPDTASTSQSNNGIVIEGETMAATCTATGGNPDSYTYQWKDASGTEVSTQSVLTITDIDRDQSGEFECIATNEFHDRTKGTASTTIRLDVQYPPDAAAISHSNNGIVIEGETVSAACIATGGNPDTYTYQWKDASGTEESTQSVLTITDIDRDQSGEFECIATNEFYDRTKGTISTTITIDVQYLPTNVGETTYAAEIDGPVTMNLTVDANPYPVIFGDWVSDSITLNEKVDLESISTVTIDKVTTEFFRKYNVSAENSVGMVIFQIELVPTGVPHAPSLTLLGQSYQKLTLQIHPGFDGGDSINILYYLEYRSLNNGSFITLFKSGTKDTTITIPDLQSSTVYEFQAYATNMFGIGDMSEVFEYKTYGLPVIGFDQNTGILSWTPHEDEKYDTVKIEMMKDDSGTWMALEQCLESEVTEFKLDDVRAEYRLLYCMNCGNCEEIYFPPEKVIEMEQKDSNLSVGATVAILLIVTALLIVGMTILIIFLRRRAANKQAVTENEQSPYEVTRPKTIEEDNIPVHSGKLTSGHEATHMAYENIHLKELPDNTYADLTSATREEGNYMKLGEIAVEFQRDRLTPKTIIYKGTNHSITNGTALHIGGNEGISDVAIKMANENANSKGEQDIIREIEILKTLPRHPNIINMLGCCLKSSPVCLIMPYFSSGNVKEFVTDNRRHFKSGSGALSERELLSFIRDVAKGMKHLSDQKIVHRYLAARHIMVESSLTCKISQFGYASSVISDDRFFLKTKDNIPHEWMAPESVLKKEFSTRSDVWSFGVVVWEIVTLGATPYEGISVARRVSSGYTLPRQPQCGLRLNEMINYCLNRKPVKRPTFKALVDTVVPMENDGMEHINLQRLEESMYANIQSTSDLSVMGDK